MAAPSAGTLGVIAISIVLVAGFYIGSRLNRLSARDRANWLRTALRGLGTEPRFSPLGSFGFSTTADWLDGPIRRLSITTLFLPRELPPVWVLRLALGQSDALTLRATLAAALSFEGDALDPRSDYGRRAERNLPPAWKRAREGGRLLAAPSEAALNRLRMALGPVTEEGPVQQIISIRRSAPQLLVTVSAPASEAATIGDIQTVRGLAEALVGVQNRG
ncbi:MAG TPA: hypothetical protein VMU89_16135 [Thermomicrobiaceae bacterium]|nr:hypothetical protein [Thermomicrobiaceae bacterium]